MVFMSLPQKKRRPTWTLADYAMHARNRGGALLTKGSRSRVPTAHERLHFRCAEGHEWKPLASGVKTKGYWCFRCARMGRNQWRLADYRKHATDHGGKLLTVGRPSVCPLVTTRLRFRCGAGHQWETDAGTVQRFGSWCRTCTRTKNPWGPKQYRKFAADFGGKLISKHPPGTIEHLTRVRFRCAEGHEWDVLAGQIRQYKSWCGKCHHVEKRKPLDDLQALAISRGGVLVRLGQNRSHPATWRCSRGHLFKAVPGNIVKGSWCPRCSASRSERIVRAHFEQLLGKPFPRVRPTWLRGEKGIPLELDGFCEDLCLAFEHQGGHHYGEISHFRTSSTASIQKRDRRKRVRCRACGVTLIEIPELVRRLPIADLRDFILQQCDKHDISIPKCRRNKHIDIGGIYATTIDDEHFSQICDIAKKHGGRCLSDHYAGVTVPMWFECAAGHKWSTRPSNIMSGAWCQRCGLIATGAKKRLTIELMRAIAAERGGECLSAAYGGSAKALLWRCGDCGNEWASPPNSVRSGSWCPPCGRKAGWIRRRARGQAKG